MGKENLECGFLGFVLGLKCRKVHLPTHNIVLATHVFLADCILGTYMQVYIQNGYVYAEVD